MRLAIGNTHESPPPATTWAALLFAIVLTGLVWLGSNRLIAVAGVAIGGLLVTTVWALATRRRRGMRVAEGTGVTHDTSEPKTGEERLGFRTLELIDFVENASIGLHWVDANGVIVWANSSELDLLGYTREEYVGQPISRFHADEKVADEILSRLTANEVLANYEARLRRKDGSIRTVLIDSSVYREHGRFIYTRCFTRDITERKCAEEELRESEERFESFLDQSPVVAWVKDEEFKYRYVNRAFEQLFALPADKLIGRSDYDVYRRESADETRANDLKVLTSETSLDIIERVPGADGRLRQWLVQKFPLRRAGRATWVGGAAVDVTARLEAEEALRASEERFRQLAENIREVFWMSDPGRTRMLYVSPAYETIWGRTCASAYESPSGWLDTIHLEDRGRVRSAAGGVQAEGDFDQTYRIMRPDGTVRWIHDRGFPVRDAAGTISRRVGTAEDITERRRLEDKFHQAKKMEALGQLAGGIAHDFNNILAAILGNAELAVVDTDPDHPARESLEAIKHASIRAAGLVQQILTFSRQQSQERRVVALGPAIDEAVTLLRASLPANVEILTSIESGVPPVLANTTQIHQVLLNLCTNAWHALEGQPGRVDIQLQSVSLDAATADRLGNLRPGRFACLSVRDTGKGIDAATVERIFDPFFTTKEQGKGTGLGLSVVHGIVQGHDGAIAVVSQPGKGATFKVYFPGAATTGLDTTSMPAAHPGEGQHILFLDDEVALVRLATRMLERVGYRVTGFTSAAAALSAFRKNPGRFDVVITDLSMPGTSGLDVASELLTVRPDVPVLLCSGYLSEEVKERARSVGVRDVLHKPTTLEGFGEALHRLTTEP